MSTSGIISANQRNTDKLAHEAIRNHIAQVGFITMHFCIKPDVRYMSAYLRSDVVVAPRGGSGMPSTQRCLFKRAGFTVEALNV